MCRVVNHGLFDSTVVMRPMSQENLVHNDNLALKYVDLIAVKSSHISLVLLSVRNPGHSALGQAVCFTKKQCGKGYV